MNRNLKRLSSIAVIGVLLLAVALRFHHLEAQSFWNDEGNSARLSERSVPLIIEGTASDIHPPLYYLVLHYWRVPLGDSEFSLRALSAFAGVLAVASTYALGRQSLGKKSGAALTAGTLLAALNPALVYYSQEARMYELAASLAALSSALVLYMLRRRAIKPAPGAAYVLITAAGLYTHYFYPAVVAAQGAVILLWLAADFRRQRKRGKTVVKGMSPAARLMKWAFLLVISLSLYLPWLPTLIRQTGGRAAVRAALTSFSADSVRWLAFGATVREDEIVWFLWLAALLLLAGFVMALRRTWTKPGGLSLYLLWTVPVLGMWMAGTTQPEFFKFMLVAAAPLCLSAAISTWTLIERPGSLVGRFLPPDRGAYVRWLAGAAAVLVLAVLVWGMGRSLVNMYSDEQYARADYRAMARQIAREAPPDAAVILDAPNQWEVFTYYHDEETTGIPVYPIPRGSPEPTAVAAGLADLADRHSRLYAIFWGENQRDPQRLVERWLDEHAFKAREEWRGDVRFVTYAVPGEPITEMTHDANVTFGDAIVLSGYSTGDNSVRPGDIFGVALFWQAKQELQRRYKVFLHLLDDNGQLVAQRDSEPGGGLALTTTWQVGETVADNHGLFIPIELPAGTYQLVLGLYELGDPGKRLPVQDGQAASDTLFLTDINVGNE